MGAVYLGVDQRFGTKVAVKQSLVNGLRLKRAFEHEAQLLNSLRHPALPHVTDYFAEANQQFLVMQYIAGEDLAETIARTGGFAVADVLRWTDELLDALDYLHNQEIPVVHRDIKPQNLKLTTSGRIILLDFGLAKGNSDELVEATVTKSIFGYSRAYAPLEQIQGTGTDVRSDLYSLAATVYHLLTNQVPVDALMRARVVLSDEADLLCPIRTLNPAVPAQAAKVLHQALHLNHNLRPESASAMRQLLAEATAELHRENVFEQQRRADTAPLTISLAATAPERVQPVSNRQISSRKIPARFVTDSIVKMTAPENASASAKSIAAQPPQTALPPSVRTRSRLNGVSAIAAATLLLSAGAFAFANHQTFFRSPNSVQSQTLITATAENQIAENQVAALDPQAIQLQSGESKIAELTNDFRPPADFAALENIQAPVADDEKAVHNNQSLAVTKTPAANSRKEKPGAPAQTVVKIKPTEIAAVNAQPLKSVPEPQIVQPETQADNSKERKSKGIKGFFNKIGSGVVSVPKNIFGGKKKDKKDLE